MNKKIIALAIAAAVAAPMAAQADATVYGKLNMAVGTVSEDYTVASGDIDVDNFQVRSIASRLGFKGSEDLGGGLSAVWKLEYGVSPVDSSGPGLSRRNQYVGLKGGFGEVRVGRHDTPTKMAQGKFDQFPDGDGDIVGAMGLSQADNRVDNAIAYINKFGAVTLAAAIVPGEENEAVASASNTQNNGLTDTTSIALTYNAKNLMVSVAADDYATEAGTNSLDSLTRIVATYKMGAMQFGALMESGENLISASGGDKDLTGLSFGMKMGKNKFKAQYLMATETNGTGVADTDYTSISLGLDHGFSKKTTGYVAYTTIEADAPGADDDVDFDSLTAGMIIKF